jgi:alpha-N-arabinofuranosidase
MGDSASVEFDTANITADVPPTIFGGFAEHMGRCVYEGIYDPQSKHSDDHGFRTDIIELLREMRLSVLRYPGGNFVSNYNWRDGIGPRDHRPRRRELAWKQLETNEFGTDEFIAFCRAADVEPMLAVNLGTGTISDASDLVEYCNAPVGTEMADLRAKNGNPKPFGVKYWCLGNEMDGPWQIGHLDAIDYARKAREAAKIMRMQDPSIQTVLCGSSGPWMKTFPQWDRTALETCWEDCNYLSLHNYAKNDSNDTTSFLGYGIEFERHIDTLATLLREIKQKLSARNDIYLSQDEWNVWYKDRSTDGKWALAPHLCEERYNLEDALVVAQWLNVFLRKCDVLKIACLAQIVNTIGPIKTRSDALLKESIYHAFVLYAQHARGRALRPVKVDAPHVVTRRFGDVPLLDVAATIDPEQKCAAMFLVHRGQTQTLRSEISFVGSGRPMRVREISQIAGLDPKAANTWDRPDVIVPRAIAPVPMEKGKVTIKLPPLSVTMVQMETGA